MSLQAVRAVQACLRADVEVVLMSGRRRAQVFEDARLARGPRVRREREEYWLARSAAGRADDRRADRALARRRCCSSTTRGAWSTTSHGTCSARSRICSAGWSTRPRPTRCWPSSPRRAAARRQRRRQPPLGGARGPVARARLPAVLPLSASKASAVAFHRARAATRSRTRSLAGDSRRTSRARRACRRSGSSRTLGRARPSICGPARRTRTCVLRPDGDGVSKPSSSTLV